jgi:molecular chaperone DnaK
VEALIIGEIDRSIEECRTLLKGSGYDAADIDRLVLIGGPTRMPLVRSRVPEQRGIAADLDSDPMTAVAMGAAIYAESRDWQGGTVKAKSSRAAARSEGLIKIEYGYPERTSDDRIRIRVTAPADGVGKGYRLQVDTDAGWTSGQLPLDTTTSIDGVPVARRGDNQFRIVVFDGSGAPVAEAEARFIVKRTDAAAVGTPITHALGVKVVEGNAGAERNALDVLVKKGEMLPARGNKNYLAAKNLKAGDDDYLDFEVYQMDAEVADPKLSLHVGAFRISAKELEPGDVIRRGDPVRVYWTLDENGLLNCALEIDAVGRRFATEKMFTDQSAQKNFTGKDGEQIAASVLDLTQAELNELRAMLGERVEDKVAGLQSRINSQRQNLDTSYEADTRRSITEEARVIRQSIAKIKESPENVGALLRGEINAECSYFNQTVRAKSSAAIVERYDRLAQQARDAVNKGNIEDAKRSLSELRSLRRDEENKQPSHVVDRMLQLARNRHLAIDKTLHDKIVEAGKASAARHDINGVWAAIKQIQENLIPTTPKSGPSDGLSGLMRG